MRILIAAIGLLFLQNVSHGSQGAATVGCDKEYPKVKADFQKAFKATKYEEAYNNLESFAANCDWIKDNRMYWIWSDLSLAAYKMKNAEKCLAAVLAAEEFQKTNGPEKYNGDKKLAAMMTPSPAALKALKHNKGLCQMPK